MKDWKNILRMKKYAEYKKENEVLGVFVDLKRRYFFVRVSDRVTSEEYFNKEFNRFDVLREEIRRLIE